MTDNLGRTAARYRRYSLPLGLLFLFVAIYGPLFYRRVVFYSADSFAFYFTQLRYWFNEFSTYHAVAFWNPYTNLGNGFLYNTTNALFYPFHALGFLLPSLVLYQTLWVGHLVLLAWGVARWGRRAGASWENLTVVTCLFAASPFTGLFGSAGFNYLYAMTWAIWILGELEGRSRSFGRLMLLWGLLLFSGEPFTAIFLGAFLSWHYWHESRTRALGFWAISAIVGLMIYGHGVLALPYSTRASGLDPALILSFSFHPARVLTFLTPYFFGSPLRDTFGPPFVNSSPGTARFLFDTPFLPTPLFLLIAFGVHRSWRDRASRPWLLGAAIALLLSFGDWGPLRWLCLFPPFSLFRYPEKFTIVAVLFALHFAFRPQKEFLGELVKPATKAVLLAVIALSTVSRDNELPMALSAVGLFIVLRAFERGRLSYAKFATAFVVVGAFQCWASAVPQRLVPIREIDTTSAAADYVAQEIPPTSLLRFEIASHVIGDDYSHRYWVYGTNMLHRRATIFGYDSFMTPFLNAGMRRLSGDLLHPMAVKAPPLTPDAVKAFINLTALRLLVVENQTPIPALLPAMETKANVFWAAKREKKWTALAPTQSPSPWWWFSELAAAEPGRDLLQWPPTVNKDRAFVRGIEQDVITAPTRCDLPNQPLRPDAIVWTGNNGFDFELESACEGWVFFSQTSLPGWRLFIGETERPLYRANETFMAFRVPEGKVRGHLQYAPFRALYEGLFARWFR